MYNVKILNQKGEAINPGFGNKASCCYAGSDWSVRICSGVCEIKQTDSHTLLTAKNPQQLSGLQTTWDLRSSQSVFCTPLWTQRNSRPSSV